MEVQLAHLHIKSKGPDGEALDTVYILENITITQSRATMPVYEIGLAQPHHIALGRSTAEIKATGYQFHHGPVDPKATMPIRCVDCNRPVTITGEILDPDYDENFSHLDSIEIE